MRNYKETIHLPLTEFAQKANLPQREAEALKTWLKEDAYQRVRDARKGAEKFTVHSGPPYANGPFHAGHLIPGFLKDIVVRSKSMQGFDTPFTPGWDTHGLPIEWQIEKDLLQKKISKAELTDNQFIELCREYADQWVQAQMQDWQRMGSLGDWDHPYITMDPKNEAGIYNVLADVAQSGLLYRGHRPVMWSTVEKTSLAEAEIEHQQKEATSCYVAFALENSPEKHVVAWTTTPWSIPSNKAVALSADEIYVELKTVNADGIEKSYIVADALKESFVKRTGMVTTEESQLSYDDLADQRCLHPLFLNHVPIVKSAHVTMEQGTGVVHIAPSHGPEDFEIGKEYNLDLQCYVDADGRFTNDFPKLSTGYALSGKTIQEAQEPILSALELSGNLLARQKIEHTYPVSWRSKAPLIYRTTSQWFIAMDKPFGTEQKTLREKALENIDSTEWLPANMRNRIRSMVADRPDWCISRQRVWGVPIAIFQNKVSGEYILDPEIMTFIAKKIEVSGISAWRDLPPEELLPAEWLIKNNVKPEDLKKETDILDVWIDAGASYSYVLQNKDNDNQFPANIYIEGVDQHRGWFQASLLLSTITNEVAPFKQVMTHGFVVDGKGKKISKSLGNGADAGELIGQYGADVLRMWVASSDNSNDIKFSPEIMKSVGDSYLKFRNTLRFMLGNLYGFDEATQAKPYSELPELEKYVLSRFGQVMNDVVSSYKTYSLNQAFRSMMNFCVSDLSSLYFDIRKDVLYCDPVDSHKRLSVQTTLSTIFNGVATHLTPIMPYTADEAWRARHGAGKPIYSELFTKIDGNYANAEVMRRWESIIALRSEINAAIEMQGRGENPWAKRNMDTRVNVHMPQADIDKLNGVDIAEIVMASEVNIKPDESGKNILVSPADGEKCPRCWNVGAHAPGLCMRCDAAVQEYDANALKVNGPN